MKNKITKTFYKCENENCANEQLADWHYCRQCFDVIELGIKQKDKTKMTNEYIEFIEFCKLQKFSKAKSTALGKSKNGLILIDILELQNDAKIALNENNKTKYYRFLETCYKRLKLNDRTNLELNFHFDFIQSELESILS